VEELRRRRFSRRDGRVGGSGGEQGKEGEEDGVAGSIQIEAGKAMARCQQLLAIN
jgi:hypothetical protein